MSGCKHILKTANNITYCIQCSQQVANDYTVRVEKTSIKDRIINLFKRK